MDAQAATIESRLQSFLGQLQSELGVLDRIIHKNKNQHRRSSYFQYLLKVRRDCKLLQSTNLLELVNSSFIVINGNRPRQKVQLLESLKRRKFDGGKHNFLARLQGAACLLSQMPEPMLKAAMFGQFCDFRSKGYLVFLHKGEKTELPFKLTKKTKIPLTLLRKMDGVNEWDENGKILNLLDPDAEKQTFGRKSRNWPNLRELSTLLARSFFTGFSTSLLALLARLRVLTQQILLDVVAAFNMVSSLSRKRQSIKLNQEGIEVYREYYPTNEQVVYLGCVWETDKFVLLEKMIEAENTNSETVNDGVVCQGSSIVEYESIETTLGVNKPADVTMDETCEDDAATMRTDNVSSTDGLSNDSKQVEEAEDMKDQSGVLEPSIKNPEQEQITCSSFPADHDLPKLKPKKVAFVSVKKPDASKAIDTGLLNKLSDSRGDGDKKDSFFSLLTGGI